MVLTKICEKSPLLNLCDSTSFVLVHDLKPQSLYFQFYFFLKNCKFLCNETVSGVVKLVFIILSLYLIPKVPIVAADTLLILNIW